MNPRKWVKKRESQIGELDKLKLKVIVLHDDIGKEIHMTQPVRFLLLELGEAYLDELQMTCSLGRGSVGNHTGATC